MTDSNETFRWEQLANRQKIYIAAVILLLVGFAVFALMDRYRLNQEVKIFEQQAVTAKREAVTALENAAKIAKEKVEQEKKLAEIEVKRDGKNNEVAASRVRVADERLELNRVRRERRGDNPSPDQLCAELDALGYSCF